MQISGVSLALTWPAGFIYSEFFCAWATATSFPLSKHAGGSNTAPTFSGLYVCLQLMWEVGHPPLSCEVFLPPPLSQALLLLVAELTPPLPPSLARPGLFIYSSVRDSPPPALRCSECSTLFATCLYCSHCLLLSFSFFPGWGSVCPGGYADLAQGCLWEYRVPQSSPCGPCLPKPSGHGRLVARGPSWFLHLMWSGDALHRLEVWRGKTFASSRWPCLQGVSPASLQDFTLWGSLSASSL
jgi:hypothetical protein